jgi:hypothetical protein
LAAIRRRSALADRLLPAAGVARCGKHTGKVKALLCDRFGDFDGFILETLLGEEIKIRSRESPVERLIERSSRTTPASSRRPRSSASFGDAVSKKNTCAL